MDETSRGCTGLRRFPALRSLLGEVIGPGKFAEGAQLCASDGGVTIIDGAWGSTVDGPLDTGHLHPVFCLTKPLAALAIGRLMEIADVDLGDEVDKLAGPFAFVPPGTTLGAVLNHSAGLVAPRALDWRLCPQEERPQLLESIRNRPANAYSEVAGGLVVEAIIERVTGVGADRWTTEEILRPAGLEDDFVILAEVAASPAVQLRVRVPFGGPKRLPLLSERLPSQLRECRLAFGAIATARGIAGVFDLWRRAIRGEPAPCSSVTIERLLACRRGPIDDPVIHRTADFAAGVAVDLAQHQLGDIAHPRAVGGVAGLWIAAGVADPDRDVSIGMYINGSTLENPTAASRVRHALINALVADLQ